MTLSFVLRPARIVLPTTVLLALLVAGCAMVERQEAENTEQLLSAAGFRIQPADTPQKLSALQAMPQRKFVKKAAPQDGAVAFYYADGEDCRCLYVGNEKNYENYNRLAVDQEIAIANQESALDVAVDSDWAYDPWLPVE